MNSPAPGHATGGQPAEGQPAEGQQAAPGPRGARGGGLFRLVLICGLLTVALAAAVAIPSYLITRHDRPLADQLPRVSGIPADVPTGLANLMSLSPLPRPAAPGFTLTDQRGHRLSLASLRGKVVVLQFMDPHCTDICPIVSQEFVRAYHDLGPLASRVVFAAVNVNVYHARVADMAEYSRAQGLTAIPDWHFFTGPAPRLRTVWSGYHIAVHAPSPDADVVHTSAVYFIDSRGRERYVASPMVDHTRSGTAFLPTRQIVAWGHGIALLARQLASRPAAS